MAQQGAGGSDYYYFTAVNQGDQACAAGGYFGAAIYDLSGRLLSAAPGRMGATLAGVGVHPLTVPPGGSVSFMLQVGENPQNGTTRCLPNQPCLLDHPALSVGPSREQEPPDYGTCIEAGVIDR